VKRQFIWVAGGRILAAVLQAAILVALARSTDPATFGFFSAVFGVGVVVQNAFDLGLGTFIVRERAHDPRSPKVARALLLSNVSSIAMGAFATALLVVLGVVTPLGFVAFLPLGLAMAAERNADVRLGVALADGDARVNTVNLVGRRLGTIVVFFVLLGAAGFDPVLAFGVAALASGAVSAIAAHRYIARHVDRAASVASVRETITAAWPFYMNSLATQLRNLDSTVVTALTGPAQGGLYAAAARLTGPLRILPTSLAAVLLPRAARVAESEGRRAVLAMTVKVVVVMAAFYALLVLAMPTALPVVLGDAYRPSVAAVQIVLGGLVFAAAASLLTSSLQGWGDARYVAAVSAVTTALCLAGVAFGAVWDGSTGAAVGLALSFAVQTTLLCTRLPRHLRPSDPPREP
jgi:O-antigen/teichoic acid export membrane protein